MSPEQAAGDPLDGRSDLFSLGIVLYECATGRRPFVGDSVRVILASILHKAPEPAALFNPDLPLKLQEIINTLLEKEPELRYQNAAGLRADLKRLKRDLESGRTELVSAASATERAVSVPCTGRERRTLVGRGTARSREQRRESSPRRPDCGRRRRHDRCRGCRLLGLAS